MSTTPDPLPGESAGAPDALPLALPRKPRTPAVPLDERFVAEALSNPLRAIDISLASPDRVGANVVAGVALGRITLVLLVTSLVFAIP